MRPSQIAATLLSRLRYDDPPRAIDSLIYEVLVQDLPPSLAAEQAAELAPALLRRLANLHARSVERGGQPNFAFNSSSPRHIQGPYFAEPRDPEAVRAAKFARARVGDILLAVRSLSFQEFELLCARLIEDIGATEAVRTPHAADQGIDFYGKLVLGQLAPSFPFLRLEDSIPLWLVGQAKHYPTGAVQPGEVRELVGAILLARHREFTVKDVYPDLVLHSCDPVVGLFITSGQFTRGSRRIAEASGIISKDGEQLSAFLADHKRGLVEAGGEMRFSAEAFRHWIQSS